MTFSKILKNAMVGAITAMGLSIVASAQVLIIDSERVEREAAPYKDFNLQTTEVREQMNALRQFVSRGGQAEKGFAEIKKRGDTEFAELEKRKAITGADKFETERKKLAAKLQGEASQLEQNVRVAQQNLQYLEYTWDQLRQEVLVQIERVRQPIYRTLVKDKKAQIILPKNLVLASAAGLDITTEYIELLNAELPTVTLTKLPRKAADAAKTDAVATPAEKK